jgi:hypothetical protein
MKSLMLLTGSAIPIILFAAGVWVFRRAKTSQKLVLLLVLLLASAPVGAWIIDQAYPPRGDNPGQGVIYVFLFAAWLLSFGCWLAWAALCLVGARRRAR